MATRWALSILLFFSSLSWARVPDVVQKQIFTERSQGIQSETLNLVVGVSARIVSNVAIRNISMTVEGIVQYIRIDRGHGEIHLTPIRAGLTDLSAYAMDGSVHKYYLNVQENQRQANINELKGRDRQQGLSYEDLVLVQGVSRLLVFPKAVGPIHLTDSNRVDYIRGKSEMPEGSRFLRIIPKKEGLTDMLVHDEAGNIIRRYYIYVEKNSANEAVPIPVRFPLPMEEDSEQSAGITSPWEGSLADFPDIHTVRPLFHDLVGDRWIPVF